VLAFIYAAATCDSADPTEACPTPVAGSEDAMLLENARSQVDFALLYPCYLPNTEHLESTAVIGEPGRRQAEITWTGTFEMTIRQSQYPPAVSPDPAGASRSVLDLFSNTRATLIERNDASGEAMYHLFWQRNDIYYELQAFGPPQQRRIILEVARSLQ
jgi:hypothetical protein